MTQHGGDVSVRDGFTCRNLCDEVEHLLGKRTGQADVAHGRTLRGLSVSLWHDHGVEGPPADVNLGSSPSNSPSDSSSDPAAVRPSTPRPRRSPQLPAIPPPPAQILEPAMPARIRRPNDAIRAVGWALATALLLLLGDVALGTASGLEEDLSSAITTLPDLILSLLAWASGLLLLVLPPLLVVDLTVRRRWRTLLVATLAAIIAGTLAYLFLRFGPDAISSTLLDALTTGNPRGDRTVIAFPLLAAIIAFASVEGLTGRPRIAATVWGCVGGYMILLLFNHSATPLALAVSVVGGHAIGVGTRYAFGTDNPRPPGAIIARAMARVAVPLAYLELVDDNDEGRYYKATTLTGAPLDVVVIDRDRRSAGFIYHVYRRLRVQRVVERRPTLSVRRAVDQAVLPVYAAMQHGVRTPVVVAAASVNRDASLVAFEHIEGLKEFDQLAPEELTDEVLADLWEQVRALHRAGVAHEELHAGNLAVDRDGRAWLLGLDSGEVAADQLTLRIDDAELLVTTAQLIGADRAVRGALQELTAQRLGEALPLLQAVALSRTNRRNLKQHKGLMADLREAVIAAFPAAPTEPVRLERLRPRTIIALLAFMFALYVLLGQLASVNLSSILTEADPGWAALAFFGSFLTYVMAAISIASFAPVALSWIRNFLTQLASTFVSLVAPAAVGNIGVNTRFIQQQGVAPAVALASVGASQVFVFLSYLVLVVLFGVMTGRQTGPNLLPGRTLLLVVGGVVVVGALIVAIPWTRRTLIARIRPLVEPTLPRLSEMARQPHRMVAAALSAVGLNLAYSLALWAAVAAYGADLSYATSAFVYMAAGAIGSAAPTPGGIGAVEAALAAGLTAAGLDGATAVQSALLFRAATFWVPVVPGWFSFQWLQRQGAL